MLRETMDRRIILVNGHKKLVYRHTTTNPDYNKVGRTLSCHLSFPVCQPLEQLHCNFESCEGEIVLFIKNNIKVPLPIHMLCLLRFQSPNKIYQRKKR